MKDEASKPAQPGVTPVGDLKRRIGIGTAWMVGARWAARLLGLVSTVVLARLLAPEDFGILAMAMVLIGVITAMTDMEMDVALISIREVGPDHFNTVWTLTLFFGLAAGLAIAALAPLAATYYDEPRVKDILLWLCVVPMIYGAANPKTALFRKDLHFHKDFLNTALAKLMAVGVSIPAAFILRDYRALVFGLIAGGLAQVLVGYLLIPYLPRPSLRARKEIFSFSVWMLLRNVGVAASSRIEQFVLGAAFGAQRTSYYYMGSEVGRMATAEFALPFGRALLPGFSLAQNDRDRLLRGTLLAHGGLLIVLPVGFGLAALAPEFISLVLSEKWLPAAGVLEVLAMAGAIGALTTPYGPMLIVLGRIRYVALLSIATAFALLISATVLAPLGSLVTIALARLAAAVVVAGIFACLALAGHPNERKKALGMTLRTLVASLVMYGAVKYGQQYFAFQPLAALVTWPLAGAAIFGFCQLWIWRALGRPADGLEPLVLSALAAVLGRVRTRLSLGTGETRF